METIGEGEIVMARSVLLSVIFSVSAIALCSLGIVGWVVTHNGSADLLNPLVLIASNVVSGLIGFMTSELVDKFTGKKETE